MSILVIERPCGETAPGGEAWSCAFAQREFMAFHPSTPRRAAVFVGKRASVYYAFVQMAASSQRREKYCRVVLTGFMGAGKSTVGPLIARRLDWDFLDVDQQLEISAGAPARELFAALGEAAFRELESDLLDRCLTRSKAIIAPGGAAIDMPRNQQALAKCLATLVVFLDAPFTTLIYRCLLQERSGEATYRPLLHKTEQALERFSFRRSLYSAHAHLTVDVAERSPEEVVLLIGQTLEYESRRDDCCNASPSGL